jgi:hypothetical protein
MSALNYIGDGSALPLVPARDLSPDEVKKFGQALVDLEIERAGDDKAAVAAARKLKPEKVLLDSGLYKTVRSGGSE